MAKFTREELRARLQKRLEEGFTPEERAKFNAFGLDGNEQTTFAKTEIMAMFSQMRLLTGTGNPEHLFALIRLGVEMAATLKLPKEDLLGLNEKMYDDYVEKFAAHGDKAVEVALEISMKTQEYVEEMKKKMGLDELDTVDPLTGFDLKPGDTVTIPKDWDKTVN